MTGQIPSPGNILARKFDNLLALFSKQNRLFSEELAQIQAVLGTISANTLTEINAAIATLNNLIAIINAKESTSNKTSDVTGVTNSSVFYPSVKGMVDYLSAQLNNYAPLSSLSNYVSTSNLTALLNNYVTTATLAAYETTTNLATTLNNYVTTTQLTNTLANYTPGGGGGSNDYNLGINETVTGTVPKLITSLLIAAGTYTSITVNLGCSDATGTATLSIYAGTTLLETITHTGTPIAIATAGFTLATDEQISFYLSGSTPTTQAFVYGIEVNEVANTSTTNLATLLADYVTTAVFQAFATSQPYDTGVFYPDKPSSSAVVMLHVFNRSVTFPVSFTNSHAIALAPAADTTVFDIRKFDGTTEISIGSLTFAAGSKVGVFTLSVPVTFTSGNLLLVVAPNIADVTLADIAFTFAGIR